MASHRFEKSTPQLMLITTPKDDDVVDDNSSNTNNKKAASLHPSTPSPSAVHEFDLNTPNTIGSTTSSSSSLAITSANRSAVVSKMLSDHLVTVNDDEVIISSRSVTLPELEEQRHDNDTTNDVGVGNNDNVPPSLTSLSQTHLSLLTNNNHYSTTTTTAPKSSLYSIQHKMLYASISSLISPPINSHEHSCHLSSSHDVQEEDELLVGNERTIYFHEDSLGIKISRCQDGYVRVLNVTNPCRRAAQSNSTSSPGGGGSPNSINDDKPPSRTGDEIYTGDVVRQVSEINLRIPIVDTSIWKLTVGLIKMAPRPLKFVVAREVLKADEEEVEKKKKEDEKKKKKFAGWDTTTNNYANNERLDYNSSTTNNDHLDDETVPTSTIKLRTIHFLESNLGIKLHHNTLGYVQIVSVTPYSPFQKGYMVRTGDDIYEGDLVLEVGGLWNLRQPINDEEWKSLVRYIKGCKRPLEMVVTDGDCMEEQPQPSEQSQQSEQAHQDLVVIVDDDEEVNDKEGEVLNLADNNIVTKEEMEEESNQRLEDEDGEKKKTKEPDKDSDVLVVVAEKKADHESAAVEEEEKITMPQEEEDEGMTREEAVTDDADKEEKKSQQRFLRRTS